MSYQLLCILISTILSLALLHRLFRGSDKTFYNRVVSRVDKIKAQAKVAIPQAADYPSSLGKEGARIIHEINSHLEKINLVMKEIKGHSITSEIREDLESYDFQHSILESEKLLKDLAKRIAKASKSGSSIGLPKASKNKGTIDSLEDVGLIDKSE